MLTRRAVLTATAGAAIGALAGCADRTGTTGPSPATSSSHVAGRLALRRCLQRHPNVLSDPEAERLGGTPRGPAATADRRRHRREPRRALGDRLPVLRRRSGQRAQHRPDPSRSPARGKITHRRRDRGRRAARRLRRGRADGHRSCAGRRGDPVRLSSTTRSDDRLVRVSLAGGKVGQPRSVLDGFQTNVNHHGGRLLFDADGLLFVVHRRCGAVRAGPGPGRAGRARSCASAPTAGPRRATPSTTATWSYGHRNIEGLAFDAAGRLWATEFGEQESDELNLIRQGPQLRLAAMPRAAPHRSGLVSPEVVWSPTSTCSPAGLAITRSTAFVGALRGQCLFAVPLSGRDAGKPKAYFARRLRPDPQRGGRAGRRALDDHQQHRRPDRPGPGRRQDHPRHPVSKGRPFLLARVSR